MAKKPPEKTGSKIKHPVGHAIISLETLAAETGIPYSVLRAEAQMKKIPNTLTKGQMMVAPDIANQIRQRGQAIKDAKRLKDMRNDTR